MVDVQHADRLPWNAQGNVPACTGCFHRTIHCLPRPRLKYLEMFAYPLTFSRGIHRRQIVNGLRTGLDCRKRLRHWQQRRILSSKWKAENICSLLKAPLPINPPSFVLSSCLKRKTSGRTGYSSYSPAWTRACSSAGALVDSGKAKTAEQLCEDCFADPSQWWDSTGDKRIPTLPDLNHKATKKTLRVDGSSTPPWMNGTLKLATQDRRQSCTGTRTFADTAIANGPSKGKNERRDTQTTRAREFRGIVQDAGGSMHLQCACSTREAIAVLNYRLQQGIAIGSHNFVDVLKRCLKQKDLSAAKEVHNCIINSGMDQDQYVASTLLNVYIAYGRLQDARRVFDQLEKKSFGAWTIMIGGYVKSYNAQDAVDVFNRMRQAGFQPTAITYLTILKACASPVALEWGKELHACIRHAGLESDVRVGSALVNMYARCGCITEAKRAFENLTNPNVFAWNVMLGAYAANGSIDDARLTFDRMEKRDVITWTRMIGAYADNGLGVEAYRLFLEMKREGFKPNAITYMSILNACAGGEALEWVKEIHGHVCDAGLESDLRVGNALVHMYAKSGSLDDSRLVFDRMERRDVITWNTMIGAYAESGRGVEAYRLFLGMNRDRFKPDAITYMNILNACASEGALEWVKEIHGHIQKAGLESDLRVGNALVHMYAKSGSFADARLVFDRMERRDVITWNSIIGAYAEGGRGVEAYRLFLEMNWEGFKPDAITYISILTASASAGGLEWVKEIHGHLRKAGLESDLRVGSALVHTYAKSGSIDAARVVFDGMEKRNVISWSAMIGGLAQHGYGHEALELFREMNANCVKPDGTTFVAVLSACCHAGLLDEGRRLFLAMTQNYGIEPTVVHYTCMVDLLGRAGHLEEAKLFICKIPGEPDVAAWGALLGACRIHGNVELGELAAKELLKLEPKNASAYVLLSNIYAAAGRWEKVSFLRSVMQEKGVRKEPGRSWIEVDGKIHDFFVGDKSHPDAKAIYTELHKLTEVLKAEGYIPDTQLVLQNIDEEDKELALCSHSEKLAIAYGLMHTPPETPIRIYKNLRVCSDCHNATKFISKVTGREIIARDANRFHHFRDGVCSCGDYW